MAITEDTANQPVAVTFTAVWNLGQTTASFTPQAGTLLVALLSGDGSATLTTTGALTDSTGGTWSLLRRNNAVSNNVGGTAEVWCRYLSAAPGSMTVTATGSVNSLGGGQLTVRCLMGASSTQPGAVNGASLGNAAAVQASVAAGTGNAVYGAALNWTDSTAMTVLGNTTAVTAFVDTVHGDNWAAFKSSAATAGTATYGYSSSKQGQLAAAEILAEAPLPDVAMAPRTPA